MSALYLVICLALVLAVPLAIARSVVEVALRWPRLGVRLYCFALSISEDSARMLVESGRVLRALTNGAAKNAAEGELQKIIGVDAAWAEPEGRTLVIYVFVENYARANMDRILEAEDRIESMLSIHILTKVRAHTGRDTATLVPGGALRLF